MSKPTFIGGETIKVIVEYEGDSIDEIETNTATPVLDIKQKIFEQTGVFPSKMYLFFKGQLLGTDKMISSYGITNGSKLIVDKEVIQIKVIANNTDITLTLSKFNSVSDVKSQTKLELGWGNIDVLLKFNLATLEDNKKISEYGIGDGNSLNLTKKTSGGFYF